MMTTHIHLRFWVCLTIPTFLVSLPSRARAEPVFLVHGIAQAHALGDTFHLDGIELRQSFPVSTMVSQESAGPEGRLAVATASAFARPGSLGTHAFLLLSSGRVSVPGFTLTQGGARATAGFTLDDIQVSPTGGSPDVFIVASLNLHLGGVLQNPQLGPVPNLEVFVRVHQDGDLFTGSGTLFPSRTGILSNVQLVPQQDLLGVDAIVTSPPLSLATDRPLTIQLSITATNIGASGNPGEVIYSTVNFENTFGFPTTGPVFNLPPGFTVNSPSGLIVDNRFVSGPTQVVPEPASLITLLLTGAIGLLGYGGWSRRWGRELIFR